MPTPDVPCRGAQPTALQLWKIGFSTAAGSRAAGSRAGSSRAGSSRAGSTAGSTAGSAAAVSAAPVATATAPGGGEGGGSEAAVSQIPAFGALVQLDRLGSFGGVIQVSGTRVKY